MSHALGMIEVYGFTTAVVTADAAAKAADVKIVALDKNKPANAEKCEVPLVMAVKIEGSEDAVQAAMEAGIKAASDQGRYITSKLIARLSEDAEWFARLDATGRDKLR